MIQINELIIIALCLQKEKKEREVVTDTDVGSGRSIPIRQVNMSVMQFTVMAA